MVYADIYYDSSGWMENIAWMQKQGDVEPAIVLSAMVGFLYFRGYLAIAHIMIFYDKAKYHIK